MLVYHTDTVVELPALVVVLAKAVVQRNVWNEPQTRLRDEKKHKKVAQIFAVACVER
jgi:hypothetical protein